MGASQVVGVTARTSRESEGKSASHKIGLADEKVMQSLHRGLLRVVELERARLESSNEKKPHDSIKRVHIECTCLTAMHYLSAPVDDPISLDQPITITLGVLLDLLDGVEVNEMEPAALKKAKTAREEFAGRDETDFEEAFEAIDDDNDGQVNLTELRQSLQASSCMADVPAAEQEKIVNQLLNQFDTDHDGKLSKAEFSNMIKEQAVAGGATPISRWSRNLMNYEAVEEKSRLWMARVVTEYMAKAPPDQGRPHLIIPYGPTGSGKSDALQTFMKQRGCVKDAYVDVNADRIVQSYMREVLQNTSDFHNPKVYFAVRKGWPSRASRACINEAICTRRHLVVESTGRNTAIADGVIKMAFEKQAYSTSVVYALTPFIKVIPRALARAKRTGQGYPSFQELSQICRLAARNAAKFREAGGDKAELVFYNNCGPEGSSHIVTDPADLEALALLEPFQHEVRAMLLREASGSRYTHESLTQDFTHAIVDDDSVLVPELDVSANVGAGSFPVPMLDGSAKAKPCDCAIQ